MSNAQLLLYVLLASLTMLFASSIVAFVYTRLANPVWRTPEMPRLPTGLAACTLFLLMVSGGMEWARSAMKRNQFSAVKRAITLTAAASLAFLVSQAANFNQIAAASDVSGPRTLYAFTFYMLTGLHAVHVVGGLIPLSIVMVRTHRGAYSSSRYEGLHLCAQYWHFLGVVWVVLLGTLLLIT